jgi:hypothetical protein
VLACSRSPTRCHGRWPSALSQMDRRRRLRQRLRQHRRRAHDRPALAGENALGPVAPVCGRVATSTKVSRRRRRSPRKRAQVAVPDLATSIGRQPMALLMPSDLETGRSLEFAGRFCEPGSGIPQQTMPNRTQVRHTRSFVQSPKPYNCNRLVAGLACRLGVQ